MLWSIEYIAQMMSSNKTRTKWPRMRMFGGGLFDLDEIQSITRSDTGIQVETDENHRTFIPVGSREESWELFNKMMEAWLDD